MSITAASFGAVKSSPAADTRVLLIIIWCAIAAALLIAGWWRDDSLSTDDAMRLVEVRDFLAGQGWFDLTQYRLNPPDGVVMHWSRLIDLPLAMLIRAGETVLPVGWVERLVVTLWPIALLLIFLAGVARLARELADETAARLALILSALSVPVLQHFRPGAIDHHNVQLVLLIWSLVHACHVPLRPRDAGVAAALSAGSLAVGMEMMPAIVALAAVTALRWIAQGAAAAPAAQVFGIVFAATMFAFFTATVPPLHDAMPACDALSVVHLMAACIGGIGLAALASLRALRSSIGRRLTAAGALAAALAVTYPACLGDPFVHLDSRLSTLWLSHVNEARSIVSMLRDLPQEVLPYYGLPLAALVLSFLQSAREPADARWSWICGAAVLGSLSLLALWLVRGTTAANAVAVALLAAAVVRMLPVGKGPTYFGLSRAALAAALLLNPLAMLAIGAAAALAVTYPACLGDPFVHLDSRLSTLWLSHVNEARSIVSMLRDLPQEVLPYYGLPLAALVLSFLQSAREPADARWSWICGAAVLGSLSLLALWLVRGTTAANAVAVALLAAAVVRMLPVGKGPTYFGLSRAALAAALLLNPLAMLAIGAAAARALEAMADTHQRVTSSGGPGTCQRASDYLALASLPKGLVLGFIDAGPFLLMQTPHAVLAAPYHRDVAGNTLMLDIFLAPLEEAQRRLREARIDYVAFCPGGPERYNYSAAAPQGLAAALGRGEVPDFLVPVPLDGHNLAVYQVRH